MKITDLMSKEAIKIHGHASSKMDAIDQMVSLMNKQGNVSDKERDFDSCRASDFKKR